jgi:hypothetical protein
MPHNTMELAKRRKKVFSLRGGGVGTVASGMAKEW